MDGWTDHTSPSAFNSEHVIEKTGAFFHSQLSLALSVIVSNLSSIICTKLLNTYPQDAQLRQREIEHSHIYGLHVA